MTKVRKKIRHIKPMFGSIDSDDLGFLYELPYDRNFSTHGPGSPFA
jgi:hypothetical protein